MMESVAKGIRHSKSEVSSMDTMKYAERFMNKVYKIIR